MSLFTQRTALVLAFVAGAAIVQVGMSYRHAPKTAPVVVVQGSEAAARLSEQTWPALTQAEVDALSAVFNDLPIKVRETVHILCEDDVKCGDLALSFDNAFETAHVSTMMEKQIYSTPGISTTSRLLHDAIDTATNGRIVPDLVPARAGYVALAIGTKTKITMPVVTPRSDKIENGPAPSIMAEEPKPVQAGRIDIALKLTRIKHKRKHRRAPCAQYVRF